MALDVLLYTPLTLPDSKVIKDPVHKIVHAFIQELPSLIVANQSALNLGKHREADDIIIKVISVHHWSKMPDVEVLINCKFRGGGDQNHKSSNKKFRRMIEKLLADCNPESLDLTFTAKIHRGPTTIRDL